MLASQPAVNLGPTQTVKTHVSSFSKRDLLKVLLRGKNSINVTTKHKKLQLQKLWGFVSVYGEDTAAPVNS